MGLLDYIRDKKENLLSMSSTTSGVGKEHSIDWTAMTEEQLGYFSALTMSKNLRGSALTFRCRPKDNVQIFTLSLSGKEDKFYFMPGKRYKVRLHFDNSVIIYASLDAYKEKHAVITTEASDAFLENVFDSQSVDVEFTDEDEKKIITRFSLKGANTAIDSTIDRCG